MKKLLFLAVVAVLALTGVYTVITLYDSNMKIGRMNQTPVIRPHEEPLLVMDDRSVAFHKSEALIRETLTREALAKETLIGSNPTKKNPIGTTLKDTLFITPTGSANALLAKGKIDYKAFCSHCHGTNLDGLGTVGQSFSPLPANLTSKKVAKLSDEELFTVISYGSKNTPALASSMSVESRKAVIMFVRAMQKSALQNSTR